MNLTESLDLYIKYLTYEKNLSKTSVISYKKDIEQFTEYLLKQHGSKESPETGAISLENFRKYLKEIDFSRYSKNTVIRKYSSLKSFFKFLENNEILSGSISSYIIPPKKDAHLYSFLSQPEINKVLSCIDAGAANGIRDRALIEFIYSTGTRVSEVENLKNSDIDIEKNEAKVLGKGRKPRNVYLNSQAAYWLKEYEKYKISHSLAAEPGAEVFKSKNNQFKNTTENAVFLNRFGKKLSARSMRNIVIKYVKLSQIDKKISPHGIRHTFATHLLQEGAGIREIQELLGHADISTTQIYTHLNIKKIRQEYDKCHPRAK